MKRIALVAIAGCFLLINGQAAVSAPNADSCQSQIPYRLSDALKKKFPDYRTPLARDNLAEDIEWNVKEGGSGCLGVAIEDFDGDGSKDYLLALPSLGDKGYLVVVALTQKNSWEFHTLDKGKEGRSRLYVAKEKPGQFNRTEAVDGPLEPGEEETMTCPHWAAVFGTTEASGVVYCFTKGKWHHVWVSD